MKKLQRKQDVGKTGCATSSETDTKSIDGSKSNGDSDEGNSHFFFFGHRNVIVQRIMHSICTIHTVNRSSENKAKKKYTYVCV